MEIKHISHNVNNKTHNANNETSNNKSAPFNNAASACTCVHTVMRLNLRATFVKIKEKEKE